MTSIRDRARELVAEALLRLDLDKPAQNISPEVWPHDCTKGTGKNVPAYHTCPGCSWDWAYEWATEGAPAVLDALAPVWQALEEMQAECAKHAGDWSSTCAICRACAKLDKLTEEASTSDAPRER